MTVVAVSSDPLSCTKRIAKLKQNASCGFSCNRYSGAVTCALQLLLPRRRPVIQWSVAWDEMRRPVKPLHERRSRGEGLKGASKAPTAPAVGVWTSFLSVSCVFEAQSTVRDQVLRVRDQVLLWHTKCGRMAIVSLATSQGHGNRTEGGPTNVPNTH